MAPRRHANFPDLSHCSTAALLGATPENLRWSFVYRDSSLVYYLGEPAVPHALLAASVLPMAQHVVGADTDYLDASLAVTGRVCSRLLDVEECRAQP